MRAIAVRLALLGALAAAGAAHADDRVPKRAPGLWETTTATGVGKTGARECIDEATDRLVRQALTATQGCRSQDFTRTADGYVSTATCKLGGEARAEARTTVTGDFATYVSAEAVTVITGGTSGGTEPMTVKTTIETRRLGDCSPGQTPGDVILPGGQTIHVEPKR